MDTVIEELPELVIDGEVEEDTEPVLETLSEDVVDPELVIV